MEHEKVQGKGEAHMRKVYIVVSSEKGPDDGEHIDSISGVYATESSARSAARRLNDMRRATEPTVEGISYVMAEEVRP